MVAMGSPIIKVAVNQTQAVIPVTLSGPTMLPVSVSIQPPQQLTTGSLGSSPAAGVKLQTSSLAWTSGQAGQRFITLDLDSGADVQAAAVLVQLAQPQNADLDPVKHASLVTGLSPQELTASFSYAPNQVRHAIWHLLCAALVAVAGVVTMQADRVFLAERVFLVEAVRHWPCTALSCHFSEQHSTFHRTPHS